MNPLRLTDEQRLAAGTPARLVYIDSAPGSGKTTVASERFGTERYTSHNDHRGVLGMSFARAAAAELRDRVDTRWGGTAVTFPHAISTLDDLHVRALKMLVEVGAVHWTRDVDFFDVVDDYSGHETLTPVPAKGSVFVAQLTHADKISSVSEKTDKKTLGIARLDRHRGLLAGGIISHDDVRRVLGAAYKRANLRALLGEFISGNFRSVIIDEIYDAAPLDIAFAEVARENGLRVTVVGDPRQALYGWRGATPDQVPQLINGAVPFRTYPLSASFRFRGDQMPSLAERLRNGQGATLPAGKTTEVDVVLARKWVDLWRTGGNVLPLSFGASNTNIDAAITLLLDLFVRQTFGLRAFAQEQALAKLGLPSPLPDDHYAALQPVADALIAGMLPEIVLRKLKTAVNTMDTHVRFRTGKGDAKRHSNLQNLRERMMQGIDLVQGLTVHQAKGRQWRRVGVALTASERALLAKGLKPLLDDDCVLYVAATRAQESCVEVPLAPQIAFD